MTDKPIRALDVNPNFKLEVAAHESARGLSYCFACGTCSAGCPVHEVFPEYDPRKILRMIILGKKDRLLSSDFIWLCSTCYTCYERCPQDVGLVGLMTALKNIAANEGLMHSLYKEQMSSIAAFGTLYKIDNKRRERLGLPPLRADSKEINEIFKITGVAKALFGKE